MEKWIDEVWSKIEKKLSRTNETVGSCIFPYTTDENGRFKPSPNEPVYKDTTAGAVAACGLLEIANAIGEVEGAMYKDAAIKILRAMEDKCCDWTENSDAILQMGTEAYNFGEKNIPIIYGDFFFIEAILKFRGQKFMPW